MTKPTDSINIIVMGDKAVDVGVHVTLYSLLLHSSIAQHNIYFITDLLRDSAVSDLEATLSEFHGKYVLHTLENNSISFTHYKGLHGNTFTYSKLLLADLVPCDTALYLDIDIVVKTDIAALCPYFSRLDQYLVMANEERPMAQSLEYDFLVKNIKSENQQYYNAGVLLINLKKWREENITSRFISFADTYNSELQCADQTVLNGVLDESEIGKLPDRFNRRIENQLPRSTYANESGILHFYGRPKPWDLFAEMVHPHYWIFKDVLNKTHYRNYHSLRNISKQSIGKFLRTYKSYIKVVFKLKV